MQTEKNPFRGMKLFFIIYFAALVLVLTFIGFMGWLGYEMVDASMKYMLFGLLVGSAMIVGTLWVVKRIWQKWVKVTVGALLTMLTLAIIVGMYLAFTMILVMVTPLHYTTLTSPAGEEVVIMRRFSDDETLMNLRLQADGLDASQGPRDENDFGYLYTAHPRKLHFFYNKDVSGEGAVEIGYASEAKLMYEWTDDVSLHLYIDAPEPGDAGEILYQVK